MNEVSLSQALRKLIEFRNVDGNSPGTERGRQIENARLRPVLLALCECAGLIEKELDCCCGADDGAQQVDICYRCKALARLTEAVKECE